MKMVRWLSAKQSQRRNFMNINPGIEKRNIFRELIATIRKTQQTIAQKTTEYKKGFRRDTNENFMYNGSFHEAVAPVLAIAQVFGIMPVRGIRAKDTKGLYFTWCSFITIYSIVIFAFLVVYYILTVYFTISQPFRMDNIDPVIFYGSIVCIYYTFGNLARKWPHLMMKWEEIQDQLPEYSSELEKAALAQKIKMITLVTLMLSLSEHLLNIITIIHYANYCGNGEDPVERFFLSQLSQMFYVMSYTPFRAFLGKLLNVIATFVWNYMDVFVMVISVGLSNEFRRVNESMLRVKGQATSENFWRQHRNHYRNLCNLCEDIDNAITFITMVSFCNNLYFVCVQLLRSFNEMPSVAHAVYFWFSLLFLIGRTLAVSLYSAEINDESKRPVAVFRSVPKDSWCLEVKRFSEEVNSNVVALSGMKFFHLTRKLVLSVAGTIVTYELVLIQFHVDEHNVGC